MSKILSAVKLLWLFAGRQIIASLLAFLVGWHVFLCVNRYVEISKNQSLMLAFEGSKLEDIFRQHDFFQFRKLLASMKTPETTWIRFESTSFGPLFTNVIAGQGVANRLTLIQKTRNLTVNGAAIGQVTTAVDLLRVSGMVFSENWLLYLTTSIFVLFVIAIANLSLVRVLGTLDASLRSILSAKGSSVSFSVLAKELNARVNLGKRGRSNSYRELLARFTATVEAVALLEMEREVSKKNAAIAQMVGMISHDVRKPFSLVKMGLGMLGRVAQDPSKVKDVISKLNPEIARAIGSVDGLLSDVLEISSVATQLIQEPVAPETLIENTLQEIFRVYPKATIRAFPLYVRQIPSRSCLLWV